MEKLAVKKSKKETIEKNKDYYWIHGWNEGYFDVNEKGHIVINPERKEEKIDLYDLVQTLLQRGIEAPILFRFDGIIKNRIERLYGAFASAIEEFSYTNVYQPAYPIKVNQQRHVVDVIRKAGNPYNLGLEVGSKPELLAVLSMHDNEKALLLCNGYKDFEYIELALLATKIGRRSMIIIEQSYELKLVLEVAEKLGIEAEIGFRMKLSTKGSGLWASSSGDRAKFGLTADEIIVCIQELKQHDKISWVKLLHFHMGSQVTSIVPIKKALREASRMYTEIAKLCPCLSFFDVGGGLGVDYEGSKTSNDSSMNYSLEEYARDVVYTIGMECKNANLPDPIIISESGRALVAHHSILVTEVIDVAPSLGALPELIPPPTKHPILQELRELYKMISAENCLECLHDAFDLQQNAAEQFMQGEMNLVERAYADRVYKHLIAKVRLVSKKLKYIPKDIEKLDDKLLDIYFCNFSVFQSTPDAWAINQIFPVMPIHRLDERPKRRASIVDLSCDSDGKIDQFVSSKKMSKSLLLHEFVSTPYYLGIFLVGAYQEILGGLHNLFGDTNAVHVDFDEEGNWVFKHAIDGDTMNEVLSYVEYQSNDLIERLRLSIEKALKQGRLSNEESAMLKKRFKQALESYTYLVV